MLEAVDHVQASRATARRMRLASDHAHGADAVVGTGIMPDLDALQELPSFRTEPAGNARLRIGLIDGYRLSRECLVGAFAELQTGFAVAGFSTLQDCLVADGQNFDLILYHNHTSGTTGMTEVSTIRRMFPAALVVILSDAEDAEQPHVISNAVKHGARGFIPTQTMGVPMIIAAIRLVCAGGTYAPLELLLSPRPPAARQGAVTKFQSPLTSRELMVLGHVHQGKANKMIAYELGMKESTVKVHVRHIMRKTGASNRVQAAYAARNLWDVLPA